MNKDIVISLDKQYTTIGGRPVRIYAIDGGGPYCVHGAIFESPAAGWREQSWTKNGFICYNTEDEDNLKEVPKTHKLTIYVHMYSDRKYCVFLDKSNSDYSARRSVRDLVAVKPIEVEIQEGEGL
jgi:hypothetical protein